MSNEYQAFISAMGGPSGTSNVGSNVMVYPLKHVGYFSYLQHVSFNMEIAFYILP